MKHFAATDLKQTLGEVLDAAAREPVTITKHSRPRFVVMSIEDYEARFPSDPRSSHATQDMPRDHLAMIESALQDVSHD